MSVVSMISTVYSTVNIFFSSLSIGIHSFFVSCDLHCDAASSAAALQLLLSGKAAGGCICFLK